MAIKGIRTIGFFGHASSGKTTIADAFLFLAGANTRFGKVSEKRLLLTATQKRWKEHVVSI